MKCIPGKFERRKFEKDEYFFKNSLKLASRVLRVKELTVGSIAWNVSSRSSIFRYSVEGERDTK